MTIAKLYFDPTESRQGTLLPQSLISSGEVLPDLEALTKADLLITLLQSNPPKLPTLRQSWLKDACENGILIQRKTGFDFLNSIPDLTGIITTMFQWSKISWLAIIGDIQYSDDEKTAMFIDDEWKITGWNKHSVKGAMRKWQLSGGLIEVFSSDNEFTKFIKDYLNGGLHELLTEEKIIRENSRQVSFADEHILNSLSLVPSGIGWNKIKVIVDRLRIVLGLNENEYPHPLLVLQVATDEAMQQQIGEFKGWGKQSTLAMREHWGLAENEKIDVLSGDKWAKGMNEGLLIEWYQWLETKPDFDKMKLCPV